MASHSRKGALIGFVCLPLLAAGVGAGVWFLGLGGRTTQAPHRPAAAAVDQNKEDPSPQSLAQTPRPDDADRPGGPRVVVPADAPLGFVAPPVIDLRAAVQRRDGTWRARRMALGAAVLGPGVEAIAQVRSAKDESVIATTRVTAPLGTTEPVTQSITLLLDHHLPPGEYWLEVWTRRLDATGDADGTDGTDGTDDQVLQREQLVFQITGT